MIPNTPILEIKLEERKIPSKTYKIIYNKNRLNGYTDGIEALKQSIYLILSTERYAYPIYSWKYGVEFKDLIGLNPNLAIPEIKRTITEALSQDDRITSVNNFKFTTKKKVVTCEFTVESIFGDIDTTLEVDI